MVIDDPPAQEQTQTIGRHSLRLEGDVLVVKYAGTFTIEEARQMADLTDRLLGGRRDHFVLADVREAATEPDPEVRRFIVKWLAGHEVAGVANFGASLFARTMSTLIMSALRILNNKSVPTAFCKTEAEARAWIDKCRGELTRR